jgi:hypothetical protein
MRGAASGAGRVLAAVIESLVKLVGPQAANRRRVVTRKTERDLDMLLNMLGFPSRVILAVGPILTLRLNDTTS